jgi:hypothetical protein
MPRVDVDPAVQKGLDVQVVYFKTKGIRFYFDMFFEEAVGVQKMNSQYFDRIPRPMDGPGMFLHVGAKLPVVFVGVPVGEEKNGLGQRESLLCKRQK